MLPLSLSFFFQERNSIIKRQLKVVPRLAKPFILSANRTYYASTSLNPLEIVFMILYYLEFKELMRPA